MGIVTGTPVWTPIFDPDAEVNYDPALTGRRIKEFRERLKMPCCELADIIGLKTETLRSYERGIRDPRAGTIYRISVCLGVPTDVILKGDDSTGFICDELRQLVKMADYKQQRAVVDFSRNFIKW